MSLYNLIFDSNMDEYDLLKFIGCNISIFGRYRDTYIDNNYIVVLTRTGGGNREDYQYVFDTISDHPWYSHDSDCSFDCTYAEIYFKIPDDKMEEFQKKICISQHSETEAQANL